MGVIRPLAGLGYLRPPKHLVNCTQGGGPSSESLNVICFISLQLQMSFVGNRRASYIILTDLLKIQLSFVPLFSFSS